MKLQLVRKSGCAGKKKPVQRVRGLRLVREASNGSVVLPQVWAVGETVAPEVRPLELASTVTEAAVRPRPELAFYRKYTEAILRRYLRMSMACGRVPSLLGRELFRGKVTHYTVSGFDDVSIFCMDVEKCLRTLQGMELELVKRIGVQQYTLDDAAGIFGMSVRGVTIRYRRAINRLTGIFLAAGMLEALKGVVRNGSEAFAVSPKEAVVENLVKGFERVKTSQQADSKREKKQK